MKKLFYILVISTIIFSSCDVNSSDNGDLDNMWYLVQVDTLSNGHSVDYRSQRVFWSFQGSIMQTNSINTGEKYIYRFEQTSSELKVSNPVFYDRVNGDVLITDSTLDKIHPFGVNGLTVVYKIESLDDNMVLSDDCLRLYFEKY